MEPKFADVRYKMVKSQNDDTVSIIATFEDGLARYMNATVARDVINHIIRETANMWLKDHYLEIAGKISVDSIVNATIGKIVVEALQEKLKEKEEK